MRQISRNLFERKVHRGSELKKYGHVYQREGEVLYEWGDSSIRAILRRNNYCGDLVQHRLESRFMEGKKNCKAVTPAEWITVKDTHEAIISKKLFEQVQERLAHEKEKVPKKKELLEKVDKRMKNRVCYNVMYCGDCGRKLIAGNRGGYWNYSCGGSQIQGRQEVYKQIYLRFAGAEDIEG